MPYRSVLNRNRVALDVLALPGRLGDRATPGSLRSLCRCGSRVMTAVSLLGNVLGNVLHWWCCRLHVGVAFNTMSLWYGNRCLALVSVSLQSPSVSTTVQSPCRSDGTVDLLTLSLQSACLIAFVRTRNRVALHVRLAWRVAFGDLVAVGGHVALVVLSLSVMAWSH
jgi:hypothetical protein